ncbi:MAG: hypothetical protein M0002_00610 [Rhodospirillales bacterium]|nr:hypothetical protein [Rhodospirillales bacterium]
MSEDPAKAAERVARHLTEHGHAEHAGSLRRALTLGAERTVLHALREACQTVLSAVEAFDPETSAMIEELRLSIDRRLEGPRPG